MTRPCTASRLARRFTWVLALASQGVLASAPARAEPIPALERYPALNDYFPYGFWYADAPHSEELAKGLGETYAVRREKVMHDMARHHMNALVPANRAVSREYLDVVGRFGIRAATVPLFLYQHVDNAGNPRAKDLDWVKTHWAGHAAQLDDHPALLAYHVFDEPHPTVSPKIRQVTELLAQVSPLHPAIYTHQNLPLDQDNPDWGRVEWALLDSLDVVLSDLYSISPAWGRDPWAYGDIAMAEYRKVDPDSLQWPIIQTFSYGATPTIGEVRVMIFHTIACGAKGMFLFTAEQAYAPWINPFFPAVGNPWFAPDPQWDDLGRIGKHLTSAGPLLIPRRLDPQYPVQVGTSTFHATVREGWLRDNGDLTRPGIHVGAFVGDGGDVLVVHNDDPWGERSGRVTVNRRGEGIYDLSTLRPVRSRKVGGGVSFSVSLAPGDGRLYLVGEDADFRRARNVVERHLYERESLLVGLDAEIAGKSGVGLDGTRQRLDEAEDAAKAADHGRALDHVADARRALTDAESTHAPHARTSAALDGMREDLRRMGDWCEMHTDFLTGDLGDDRLDQVVAEVAERSRQFAAIENGLRDGQPKAEAAEELRARITEVADRLVTWRPRALESRRIGLLELGEPTEDGRLLRDWLAMVYRRVDIVRPTDGLAGRLGRYDVLWIHLGDPGSAVKATYCDEARVTRRVLSSATVSAVRDYVTSGGGLILSGLGASLITKLGYETTAPNERYWGPLEVPGGAPMPWVNFGKSGHVLGLKPLVPDHPILEGLPPDGFGIWDWGLSEVVGKAVWRRPAWPKRGNVLAGYYSDGAEIPDEFGVVVEYDQGGSGRVIAIGDCLDPARDGAYAPGARWGTNQDRLIRNLVTYCSASHNTNGGSHRRATGRM